jgi:hypothetical protein
MSALRARDQGVIRTMIMQNKSALKPFNEIMEAILTSAEKSEFRPVKTRGLFTDGFLFNTYGLMSSTDLEAHLRNFGLNVRHSWPVKMKDQVFIMLSEEGHDLEQIMAQLANAVEGYSDKMKEQDQQIRKLRSHQEKSQRVSI